MQEELEQNRKRWLECVQTIADAAAAREDAQADVIRWSALEEDPKENRDYILQAELTKIIGQRCEEMASIETASGNHIGCPAVIGDSEKVTPTIRLLVAVLVAANFSKHYGCAYRRLQNLTATLADYPAIAEGRAAFNSQTGILFPLVRLDSRHDPLPECKVTLRDAALARLLGQPLDPPQEQRNRLLGWFRR